MGQHLTQNFIDFKLNFPQCTYLTAAVVALFDMAIGYWTLSRSRPEGRRQTHHTQDAGRSTQYVYVLYATESAIEILISGISGWQATGNCCSVCLTDDCCSATTHPGPGYQNHLLAPLLRTQLLTNPDNLRN